MKNTATNRILITGDDLCTDSIATAVSLADDLCKRDFGQIHDVVLYIPTKQNIKGTSIESVLGVQICKTLYKRDSIKLSSGKTMRLGTMQTFKMEFKRCIVIAIYADDRMMDQVDAMKNLHSVIAVPHVEDALNNWSKTWSPIEPGKHASDNECLIEDSVIVSALDSLTNTINLSHSTLNSRDKETANNTVRILRRNEHYDDSSNIRAWAVKNGWHPKTATELEKLWDKVFSLKGKPKVNDVEQAKRTYKYWVEKAQSYQQVILLNYLKGIRLFYDRLWLLSTYRFIAIAHSSAVH